MGRPTKFTRERRERFLVALAGGVFPETAARHAGWSAATLYRILAGQSPEHAAFREDVRRVETELELRLAATITQAAFADPRLALALLERRFAARWGRGARLVALPDEAPAHDSGRDEVLVLDPAFVDAVVPKLLEARARGGADLGRVARFEDRGFDRASGDDR